MGSHPPFKYLLLKRETLTKGDTKMNNYNQHVIDFWNWVERTIENNDYGLGRNNDGSFIKD